MPTVPIRPALSRGPTVSWDDDSAPTLRQARADAERAIVVDPVRAYLKQIARASLLNAEQEVELAKRIEAGVYAAERLRREIEHETASPQIRDDLTWISRDGQRAKRNLMEANLRLVVSVAKRYTGRGIPFLDLIQEGNLGLMRAVEKFDYTKGYKFSTYATWWIRQAVARSMADQARTIRIPVHLVELLNQLRGTERLLLRDLGREPTVQELGRELDITPERVRELRRSVQVPVSLDDALGEGNSQLGDLIEDVHAAVPLEAVAHGLLREQLHDVLATLTEREAGIVRLRFGFADGRQHTLEEISKVYGVTRERIRQIEVKAMSKLRHPSRCDALRGYLDG